MFSVILPVLQCNLLNSVGFQEDMQILKMKGDQVPVINMYCANQPVLICEKAVSNNFAVTDLSS